MRGPTCSSWTLKGVRWFTCFNLAILGPMHVSPSELFSQMCNIHVMFHSAKTGLWYDMVKNRWCHHVVNFPSHFILYPSWGLKDTENSLVSKRLLINNEITKQYQKYEMYIKMKSLTWQTNTLTRSCGSIFLRFSIFTAFETSIWCKAMLF